MSRGGSRGSDVRLGSTAAAIGLLVLAAIVMALMPARASALDSDLKHSYAFKVKASNGYSLFAIADSQRLDGSGEIVLFVGRRNASVIYQTPATVTATRIEADLGPLGLVSLDVEPSGRKRVQHTCGRPKTVTFEPPTYSGVFEFKGEEGYTAARSSAPHDFTRFFTSLACRFFVQGESNRARLPGARLRMYSVKGSGRLNLQVNKNRQGARARFMVEMQEEPGEMAILRTRTLWAGAGAFAYDPSLRTANLTPPAPFSGHASFHRNAQWKNRWSGDLTIDLPGRSDVPLTGAGYSASLVHACRVDGERSVDCGRRGRTDRPGGFVALWATNPPLQVSASPESPRGSMASSR